MNRTLVLVRPPCRCGRSVETRGLCHRCYEHQRTTGQLSDIGQIGSPRHPRLYTYAPAVIARMRAWDWNTLDLIETAWAGGLFEGEGAFVGNGRAQANYIRAQLAITDRDVAEHFFEVIGLGTLREAPSRTVTGKPVYRWDASGPKCEAVAILLWPWLGRRRRERAIAMIRAWRTRAGDIGREETQRRRRLFPADEPGTKPEKAPQTKPESVPQTTPEREKVPA